MKFETDGFMMLCKLVNSNFFLKDLNVRQLNVSSMLFSFTFSRALPDGAISKILEVAEVSTAVSNLKNGIVQCLLLSNHILS